MRIRVILLSPADMTDIDEKSAGVDFSRMAWSSIEALRFLQALLQCPIHWNTDGLGISSNNFCKSCLSEDRQPKKDFIL